MEIIESYHLPKARYPNSFFPCCLCYSNHSKWSSVRQKKNNVTGFIILMFSKKFLVIIWYKTVHFYTFLATAFWMETKNNELYKSVQGILFFLNYLNTHTNAKKPLNLENQVKVDQIWKVKIHQHRSKKRVWPTLDVVILSISRLKNV